jgi:hypothetical protein
MTVSDPFTFPIKEETEQYTDTGVAYIIVNEDKMEENLHWLAWIWPEMD